MQNARLIFVLLLVTSPVFAASPLSGDLSRESGLEIDSPGAYTTRVSLESDYALMIAPPAPLTDASAQPRVKVLDKFVVDRLRDKRFMAVVAALGRAETRRLSTRQMVLQNEHEPGAPSMANVPTNHQLIGKYTPLFAAQALLVYELKKPNSRFAGNKTVRKLSSCFLR